MEIKDLQGMVITVTDLARAIVIVREFLAYRHQGLSGSLIRLEQQRIAYWRDVFRQLIILQHNHSGAPPHNAPEFITEKDKDEWQCICGNDTFGEGFETCDTDGHIMEPLIGSGWQCHYLCKACGRIIEQETLQVIGSNENGIHQHKGS